MGYGRVLLDTSNDVVSEVGVAGCKLVGEGGKYVLELPPVEVIAGTEKASTEGPLIGNNF